VLGGGKVRQALTGFRLALFCAAEQPTALQPDKLFDQPMQ